MKFPAIKAFGATLVYLARHAVDLLKALWLPALLLIVAVAAVTPDYLDAAIAFSALGPNSDPTEAMALIGPMLKSIGLQLLIAAVFYPMLIVASLRHIVRGEEMTRPFYLGYGGDELRALGAYALIVVMITIIALVYRLAVGVVTAVFALVSPEAAGIGGLAAGVAGLGVLFWFIARISVSFPAALATKTLGLAQSWRATKGQSVPLLAYWILIGLALFLVTAVYAAATMQPVIGVYGEMLEAARDPAAQQAASVKLLEVQRELYDIRSAAFWPFIIGTYLFTMAMMAAINVAAGTAWRFLTDASPAPGVER